jgi:hypothetical protein
MSSATGVHLALGVQLGGIILDPGGAAGIGRARLVAPRSGCRRAAFSARVEGDGIKRVEYRLDGRRFAMVRKEGFFVRVPVRGLSSGSHRLTAIATYGSRPDSPTKRLGLNFRRCK